jgi:hypothetical protein
VAHDCALQLDISKASAAGGREQRVNLPTEFRAAEQASRRWSEAAAAQASKRAAILLFPFLRMAARTFRTLGNRPCARVFRPRCQRHRKRESLRDVNGCGAAHIRLRLRPRWARHPINS